MNTSASATPPIWQPIVFAALAGGMAWGIRGQYGHETGAMMAGLLVGLVLVLLFRPNAVSLDAARAVAWCTVAMGFGGCMTYGQTLGLTHNPQIAGNWDALRWGMLGLAVKGGLWIGFAGAFFGMGLGGVKYRPLELLGLMLASLALFALGIWLINSPFDPANRVLPKIYFSADWHWQPNNLNLKPRPEVWGGLLLALIGLLVYTGAVRKDRLALRLAGWAVLGGAIGFPLGQSIQAYHAWNPEVFRQGVWLDLAPHINWWNMMETTFGAVAGASIGLGLWVHRRLIAPLDAPAAVSIRPGLEWTMVAAHVVLLVTSEFELGIPEGYTEYSLLLGLIPIVGIAGGRWWPYLIVLPITLLPIAGKTVRELVYREDYLSAWVGWPVFLVVPLAIATIVALYYSRGWRQRADPFLGGTLLVATWLIFALNYAFFQFPWPWTPWTSRTPNGIIYTVCALALTLLALDLFRRREIKTEPGDGEIVGEGQGKSPARH